MTQMDVLKFLIDKGSGRSEADLARAVHGEAGYQQQINQDCALLLSAGLVERRGSGGPADPFRYWPA